MKNLSSTQILLKEAVADLQAGKLDQALLCCKKILSKERNSLDANLIAGVVLLQKNDFANALPFFNNALKLSDQQASIWSNRSLVLAGLKQFDDAIESVDRAISMDPNFAESFYNKATILIKLDRLQDAVDCLDRFISFKPDHYLALFLKSDLLRKLEKFELSIEACKQVIQLKPDYIGALLNLGQLLSDQERYEEALIYLQKVVDIDPKLPAAHNNLGVTLERMGKFELAHQSFTKAIEINPLFTEALLNCGVVLEKMGRLQEAISYYDEIISKDSKNASAFFNRATCYERLQKLDESISDYNKVIELEPKKELDCLWNRSLVMLCKGDYENGWLEYENRLKLDYAQSHYAANELKTKSWNGDAGTIQGKVLLVRAEQGLGDTLQFCRYVKYLARMGAKVTFRVQKPLVSLLQKLEGVAILQGDDEPLPEFDYCCNLMSLPLLLGTTLSNIPNEIPYLKADSNKVSQWSERLGPKTNIRVGLVWSGGFRPDRPDLWLLNRRRNIELVKLKGLKTDGIEFHSLQKGELPEAELVIQHLQNWDGPKIINHADVLNDFTDTAALLENLDLLISVDTSTAHLAGALGRPVWLMNRFDTCWRWFLDREDSPWYPTFRIFRQHSYDDWGPVVSEVQKALNELKWE